jgi:transcriptional regulator with XRE-family HTH domain
VISTETVTSLREVGRKLRELRLSRGRSLAEVAEATELSPSFLSLVETGKSDISIGRLVRLVQFYGVGLADLLPTAGDSPEVVRSGERRHVISESEGIDQYLLAPDANRTMMPLLAIRARSGSTSSKGRWRSISRAASGSSSTPATAPTSTATACTR